jgi:hypothetical protein
MVLNWKKTSLKNGIKLKLESRSAEKNLEQFFPQKLAIKKQIMTKYSILLLFFAF